MGFLSSLFHDPLKTLEHNALPIVLDTAAIATGNPELLPLAQGVGKAGQDLISGKNVGTSLENGAIQGLETYGGQAGLGAIGSVAGTDVSGLTGGNGSWLTNLFSSGANGGGDISGGNGFSNLFGGAGNDAITDGASEIGSGNFDVASAVGSTDLGTPGAGVTAGAGATDAFGNSISSFLPTTTGTTGATDSSGGLLSWLKNNPGTAAKLGISAAGLGLSASKNNAQLQGQQGLAAQAGQAAEQSKQLESYLSSGTLPPGIQASINQATDSAKASVRSEYASRGMSGSSAEAQDLANVDQRASGQGAEIAMKLMETGIQQSGLSSEIYNYLMRTSYERDKDLQGALTNFASALPGGGKSQQPAAVGV